jgi:hypothetical protein
MPLAGLSGAMMNRMRAQAARFLTDSCDIERNFSGKDRFGAVTDGWSLIGSSVVCRVIEPGTTIGSTIIVAADQVATVDEYRLALPKDTDIDEDDRVTVGAVTYQVVRLMTELTDEFFETVVISVLRDD